MRGNHELTRMDSNSGAGNRGMVGDRGNDRGMNVIGGAPNTARETGAP